MNKSTEKLIKLVTKHASENDAPAKAKGLIAQGADITAPTNYGSMLDVVNTQTKCLKQLSSPAAQNCEHVAHLLQRAACERLARQVLSNDGVDIRELQTLVRLEANCQQYEMYGPLGLLGALLNQVQVPVRLDVVRFLIENDPNRVRTLTVTDGQGKTCIHIAKLSSKSPTEVADYLQRQFDSILNQIPSSNPPTDENLIRTWIRLGANPEAVDENGNTVLSNAASKNNLALVRLLVSIGSDLTHKNRQGLTPLDLAERAEPTNPPLIKFLKAQNVNGQFRELILKRGRALTIGDVHSMLDQGLNINCPMPNNDSLLHLLIIHQAPPELVITFVNDLNADLSAANLKGHRAIEACILVDKDPCPYLKLLMKSPKMTSDKFKNATSEKTILQFAIENTRSHAASLIQEELNSRLWDMMMRANTDEAHNKSIIAACDGLIACGAQINHLHTDNEHDQWTVLHLACKLSTVSVVTHLVGQTKADFALRNGNSDSPLSTAAQYGYLPIVRYLHGLSKTGLHIANKDKETPLHLATRQQHLPVIRYLVRWGADHQALNRSKYTALDIAHQIAPRNKEEEMRHKEIIQFLTQLVCPPADQRSSTASASKKPSPDLDVCDLAPSVTVNVITMTTNDAEARRGEKSKEFLGLTPNEDLYEAAKRGAVERARRALKNGADIRYRKDGRSLYEIACIAANEYNAKSKSSKPFSVHAQRDQSLASNCQQIAQLITQIAQSKIVEAIGQSSAGLVVAYHAAGASLTADLLDKACTAADNVEIVDYLLANSTDINRAMLEMIATKSPYHIAKQRQFSQVAAYIKYRLSLECTNAIKANNLVLVRNLVRAGASVDTTTSNSLNDAIQLQNTELIQFLCENGALMPREWLSLDSIILDTTAPKHWKPSTLQMINRYLIDRRLRFAAAGGNYADLMKCLHLGANIDSLNCHGSSALLCALQHGDYFQIVHALVSRGASVLHSNESQPISFINLATENNYKRIADYLAREINTQFRSAVLNDDWKGAERFTRSGANVSCQDEQQRTPLHYAVQYHGVDWVRWLCTRGSDPNICDMNGDYPIHQAVEKGRR